VARTLVIPPPRHAPARLIPFAAATPARNMALDAALLALADRSTLRLYAWAPHGVSLGRFQGPAEAAALAGAGLPMVRRMTGGGAIVHAHEVTYSVLVADDHPALRGVDVKRSYAVLHGPVRVALAAFGVDVDVRDARVPTAADRDLLCFARATELDLVAAGRKITGSAQRRTPGRVLQHGSILLRSHPLQPGTASIEDVVGVAPAPEAFADALAQAFESLLGPLERGAATAAESAYADGAEAEAVVR